MILAWAVTATVLLASVCCLAWFALWHADEAVAAGVRLMYENRDLRVRLETYRDDETYELLDRALDNDTGEC